MKTSVAAVALAALAALAVAPVLKAGDKAAGGLRYSVTVSEFENRSGWHGQWDLGDAWGMVLTDLLQQTGRFIVLGESDMREASMQEQDLAASGRTAGGKKAPETGQMTPAQLLVKGAITHVQHDTKGGGGGLRVKGFGMGGGGSQAEINATIYIVDSTTGQVLASKSVVGTSKSKAGRFSYSGSNWGGNAGAFKNDNVGKAVESACSEAVDFMTGQLPNIAWTGSVVMVKGDKVYVNRGEREGLQPGSSLLVGHSEVIRDPDTGEVLDEEVTRIAQLQCDSVKEKLSICSVTGGSAQAVKKGMTVRAD